MPKDVAMNANHIESGLTAVDAYKQSTGACGGIDFWGKLLGSGLLQLMLTGSILSKVEVGTPNVTIAVARNQMM